jgi:hypothetical protein
MRFMKTVIGSAAVLIIVNACADAAVRDIGKVMVDAGEVLGGRPAGDVANSNVQGGRGSDDSNGRDAGMLADAGALLIDGGLALIDAADQQVPDAAANAPLAAVNGTRVKLRRSTFAGADGTRYEEPWLSYYDSMLKIACTNMPSSDGTLRCMPQPGVTASPISTRFADAGCTSRLAIVGGTCEVAQYAYESGTAKMQCDSMSSEVERNFYRIYRLGAQHTGQQYEKDSQGSCKVASAFESKRFYVLGAEMQPGAFVEFTSTVTDVP